LCSPWKDDWTDLPAGALIEVIPISTEGGDSPADQGFSIRNM
jgi:hypothetical protein